MIGRTIAQYRVIDELGSGSMSVVYRAEDLRLGRQVALKFLPPSLARNPEALERFRREARVTSALNHPNICTVHDFGEHDGRQFIVMERLEGMTLKAMLESGPLPVERVIQIGIDVANALEAAHRSGILHRDVKPANIFITTRGDAKVMDFGLAKVIADGTHAADPHATTAEALHPPVDVLTGPGAAMGTIAYMSPEQARGEILDARSDLFSLGAVLYEMATGVRPFMGSTLAVVFDGILNRPPKPPRELVPELPPEVEAIILHALEKPVSRRYGSMSELETDLRRVKRRLEAQDFDSSTVILTPPRPSFLVRFKLPILIAALVLLAVAAFAGVRLYRAASATVLTDRDSVLLGGFDNGTGEPVFDGALRQALAIQLGQSPFLDLVGEEHVQETLRAMGRDPAEALSRDVAREVCQRQGVKAMIEGSIAALGSHYVVALTATACEEGRVIGREQVEAERKEDVLKAVSKAASQLRAQLGESLSMLRRHDVPIEQATTPSLEALKAYSLGIAQRAHGDELESIPFFERAVEIDPRFALAYTMLSTVYGNLGEAARATEYARKAYELRANVSERERLTITLQYYDRVRGELDKSIETLLLWEESFPRDYRPSNSLSVLYSRAGQYEQALAKGIEALRRNPDHPFPYSNVAHAYRSLNRWDEARQIAERAASRQIETLPTRRLLYQLAVQFGDDKGAQAHMAAARGRGREFDMVGAEAQIAVFRGRLGEARAQYARAMDMVRRAKLPEVLDGYAVQWALMEAVVGSPHEASRLARPVLENANHIVRLSAAAVLGLAGETKDIGAAIEAAARSNPTDTMITAVYAPSARGALLLAQGDAKGAIAALEPARAYELGRVAVMQPVYLRGLAYLKLGDGRAAAAEFQKILDHRGVDPFSVYYAFAPLGLARGRALAGSPDASRKAYEQFLDEWKGADPGLPVVAEAKAELDKLTAKFLSTANPR